MFGGFLLVLATVWAVVVTDGVVESARTGGRDLVEFGRRLASPASPEASGSSPASPHLPRSRSRWPSDPFASDASRAG